MKFTADIDGDADTNESAPLDPCGGALIISRAAADRIARFFGDGYGLRSFTLEFAGARFVGCRLIAVDDSGGRVRYLRWEGAGDDCDVRLEMPRRVVARGAATMVPVSPPSEPPGRSER